MLDMKRREFIALLGAGGLLVAVKVRRGRAQQPAMPVVGFVSGQSAEERLGAAFRKALNETGYVEGQNVMVEYHWLDGQYNRVPSLVLILSTVAWR
jgi:putative tryptophan/tyrosine transport system substrate-binding protein